MYLFIKCAQCTSRKKRGQGTENMQPDAAHITHEGRNVFVIKVSKSAEFIVPLDKIWRFEDEVLLLTLTQWIKEVVW